MSGGKHAELSPSSAARWMLCPGSVAASRGIPDSGSRYAIEGSDLHELAAECLLSGTQADSYIGRKMPGGTIIDEFSAADVQRYVDFIGSLRESIGGGELLVERRLPLEFLTGEADAHGTADAVLISGDTMIVPDLKMGMGRVDAEGNPQLRIYALAALYEYGLVYDIRTVRTIIFQPRLNHISEEVLTVEELDVYGTVVRAAAEATRDPDAPRVPGPKQCQWCKAKATCPEVRDDILRDFVSVDPGTSRPEDLARVMDKADLIEVWLKAIRAEAERRLLAGEPVPGFKLVQGRKGSRKWTDEVAAEAALKALRLTQAQMYDMSLISPTTAEKLLKTDVIGPRQWAKLADLITQTDGKPSVAPESDKRPALVMSAVDADFADVTELA